MRTVETDYAVVQTEADRSEIGISLIYYYDFYYYYAFYFSLNGYLCSYAEYSVFFSNYICAYGSLVVLVILINHIFFYPTPFNTNYFYCIGSLLGLILFSQLLSGVLIACMYIP